MKPDDEAKLPDKAAVIISIQSWATPIIGIVMLIVGLLGGYFGRPLLSNDPPAAAPVAANSTQAPSTPGVVAVPTVSADQKQAMQSIIGQTRHFLGDANAPVTIIEFSDFQ